MVLELDVTGGGVIVGGGVVVIGGGGHGGIENVGVVPAQ